MSSIAMANHCIALFFEVVHDIGIGHEKIRCIERRMRWKMTGLSMTWKVKAYVIELLGQ